MFCKWVVVKWFNLCIVISIVSISIVVNVVKIDINFLNRKKLGMKFC